MKITWQVDDGYAGPGRPQHTEIPDDEFEGMSEAEREKYIEEYIQEEFEMNISWYEVRRED